MQSQCFDAFHTTGRHHHSPATHAAHKNCHAVGQKRGVGRDGNQPSLRLMFNPEGPEAGPDPSDLAEADCSCPPEFSNCLLVGEVL